MSGNAALDRLVHEPARLVLLASLSVVRDADFVHLISETGLTKGNLASHMDKLERAEYVEIEKTFVERTPRTLYRLTRRGRRALRAYRKAMLKLLEGLPP